MRYLLIVLLFSVSVQASTYTIERVYTDPYGVIDDMYCLLFVDTVLQDSIHCEDVDTSNACTCSVTLDEDSTYYMEIHAQDEVTGWLDPGWEAYPRRNDSTMAPTYNVRKVYTDPYDLHDSMMFLLRDGATIRDSFWCDTPSATNPCTVLFNINDDSIYYAELHVWEAGTGKLDASTRVYGRWGYPPTPVTGSLSGKTCVVSVVIRTSAGEPQKNVWVSMKPAATARIIDSSGYAVIPSTQKRRTNASGVAQFTCMWSSYMIPATDWNVQVLGYGYGSLQRQITVPRDTVYTVDLR